MPRPSPRVYPEGVGIAMCDPSASHIAALAPRYPTATPPVFTPFAAPPVSASWVTCVGAARLQRTGVPAALPTTNAGLPLLIPHAMPGPLPRGTAAPDTRANGYNVDPEE